MKFKIRAARKEDCKDVHRMIMELAVFAEMPDLMKISHEEVPEDHKSKDGFTVVGYAMYFYSYSSWNGRAIYLEDVYVMEEFRGNGIGKSLLSKVAEMGKEKKCVVLDLSVWKSNSFAKNFYEANGALNLTETTGIHRLRFEKVNMEKLAKNAPKDESCD